MTQFGTRKRLFAAQIAAGKTVPAAGAAVNVSERTSWRWAADPAVKAEVRRLEDAMLLAVAARLRQGALDALGWVAAVGADPAASPGARVAAGKVWLSARLEYADAATFEARLSALETKLAEGGG